MKQQQQLSSHFKRREFVCRCGCGGFRCARELIAVLENARAHFNSPVVINSGFRCVQHNKNVGGQPNSRHLRGDAADIAVRGVAPNLVADYLESQYPDKYGIGRYRTFTHIDVRPTLSRWGRN